MVSLTCVALHPSIPNLDPGVSIGLSRARDGGIVLHVPGTPRILTALVAALKDRALQPPPSDPFWDELEAEIMATRDELLARADQILSQNSVAHLRAS